MPTLCKPVIKTPEHIIRKDDVLKLCDTEFRDHPKIGLLRKIVHNTTIVERRILQPLSQTLNHPGVKPRHDRYETAAKNYALEVSQQALQASGLRASDLDLVIAVSCTGFLFPSLTAFLINTLGLRPDTKQLPIAQLGCAAGGAALNRAYDYCRAHPNHTVLIVAVEFCSLLYQPTERDLSSLVSYVLFGDAVGACIIQGAPTEGVRLDDVTSFLVPNTEKYISYDLRDTGFHFMLDKRVRDSMAPLAPVIRQFLARNHCSTVDIDHCVFHAGGPRLLNDLVRFLELNETLMRYSRATLRTHGNIASVFVLDAMRRIFEEGPAEGDRILLGGFGPGITAEFNLGTWTGPQGGAS